MSDASTAFVEQVDELARVMGLDVRELHELHRALSRRVTRLRLPETFAAATGSTAGASADALPAIATTAPPVGLCARTGEALAGWDYVEAYIEKVFTTRYGSRVMRRHLGTEVPQAQDALGSQAVILQVFRSMAEALEKHVPWYRAREIQLVDAGSSGDYLFLIAGTYYPNAHKGDYSVGEAKLARILVSAGGEA